ncbi:uncharacterized protein LOC115219694, partial [Argonauta hians]
MAAENEKYANIPKWLIDCKEAITTSSDWMQYVFTLNDAIKQQLEDSHVPLFTDLNQISRIQFVDTAMRATENGTHYQSIINKVTDLIHHYLHPSITANSSISHLLHKESEIVIHQSYQGIEYILRRWPLLRSKLVIFFNCPLPAYLRQLVWKIFLSDPKISLQFQSQCVDDPDKKCLFNPEISENCRKFIRRINLQGLNRSEGAFYCMKNILSFYQLNAESASNSLEPKEYFISVPFLLVAIQQIQTSNPVQDKDLLLLIEEYCSFMNNLPKFIQNSDQDFKFFTLNVIRTLKEKYPNAEREFAKKCALRQVKVSNTDAVNEEFIENMSVLLKPVLQNMFVVYFCVETLLFVWDQYILTSDIPSFQDSWLIAVTAISLNYLKGYLKGKTVADINRMFIEKWPKITVLDLQFEIKHKFNEEFRSLLDVNQQRKMTFLDPSLKPNSLWQKWYTPPSENYTQPQNRRLFKEVLHAEKERINQQLEKNRSEMEKEKLYYKQQLEEIQEHSRNEKQIMIKEQNELQEKLDKKIEEHKTSSMNTTLKMTTLNQELEAVKEELQTLKEQNRQYVDSDSVYADSTSLISARLCQ